MAEFVQTMKDWRRMCKALGNVSCDGCKLHADGNDCVAVYEGEMDYAKAEKVITAWAAKHPDPVYPTWAEFLHEAFCEKYPMPYRGDAAWFAFLRETPIPADVAQKLGLRPKEG